MSKGGGDYTARENARVAAYQQKQRRQAQDITNDEHWYKLLTAGPEDPERRKAATDSFRAFCETYGSAAFTLGWSPAHLMAIEKIEAAVLDNAKFALAMPRGSGKSTLCHWAMIWAAMCGHSSYAIYVAATAASAGRRLENLKKTIRFSELLLADFPELVVPIKACNADSRKALGQLFNGESTSLHWGKDKIVLPSLDKFLEVCSWAKDFPPAFGAVIDSASIDGEIRGRAYERQDGTTARPDVAIIDDPQTRQSAKSPQQVEYREAIVKGDIGYLGGPDTPTGMMVPCTVIYQDDLACRLLDHEKNPEFKGELTKMMNSMPGDGADEEKKKIIDALWNEYDEKRKYDHLNDTATALDFYLDNQDLMDFGAAASWEERFSPVRNEATAIQSAMNLFLEDQSSFYAEAQNEPLAQFSSELEPLNAKSILGKTEVHSKRYEMPENASLLTAFIDISKNVLWYTVVAFEPKTMRSRIVDYGAFPDQVKNYYTLSSLRYTIPDKYPGLEYSAQLTKALEDCVDMLMGRVYCTEAGDEFGIERIGVDSGWGVYSVQVYNFCRRSKHSAVLQATKGIGIGATRKPLVDPEAKTRQKRSNVLGQWAYTRTTVKSWLLTYDANAWKTHVSELLRADKESATTMTLYGKDGARAAQHAMIAEQLSSEYPTSVESPLRKAVVWQLKPNMDNHFLDCVSGCCLLAHTLGATLPSLVKTYKTTEILPPLAGHKPRRPHRKVKF